MDRILGIDLGTSNCCMAVMEGVDPIIIPNNEGERTTPSMVSFDENGRPVVGKAAKHQSLVNPEKTIFSVKRLIGRRFSAPEVETARKIFPFQLVEGPHEDLRVRINDHDYSPPEIQAMILAKLKADAEAFLGEKIHRAIITVPAYFDDSQRQATKDAGKIAGLDVLRIINEPTAAALAYGAVQQNPRKIAVYDLGGGTFDISLMEIGEGVFQVLSTNGNTFLGGDDFDQRLIAYLLDLLFTEHGVNLAKQGAALQRLKEAAEKAKRELSSGSETTISIPFLEGSKHLEISFTRTQFEELTADLVDGTLKPCQAALEDAGMSLNDINEVLLVGGQTRMPLVQERVAKFFECQPRRGLSPDEVVAMGAAIQGGILAGDVKEVLLLDVVPLSLGIETVGGVFTKIIPRNTTVPIQKSRRFSTVHDYQDTVTVHILQGEREMAGDNKSLGIVELYGIPPALQGVPQIDVSFEVDANGILNVTAKNLGTGQEQALRITGSSGLTEEEVNRMVKEAEEFRTADLQKKELAALRSQADQLLDRLNQHLPQLGRLENQEMVQVLKKAMAALEVVRLGNDIDRLQKAYENLSSLMSSLPKDFFHPRPTAAPSPPPPTFSDENPNEQQ